MLDVTPRVGSRRYIIKVKILIHIKLAEAQSQLVVISFFVLVHHVRQIRVQLVKAIRFW